MTTPLKWKRLDSFSSIYPSLLPIQKAASGFLSLNMHGEKTMAEEEVDIRGETFIHYPGLNGLTLVPLGSECVLIGGGLVAKLCPTLANPWTVALKILLPMGFSRQEYWSRLPFPSPGDLPDPGTEPVSPVDPALQADSLPLSYQGSPLLH